MRRSPAILFGIRAICNIRSSCSEKWCALARFHLSLANSCWAHCNILGGYAKLRIAFSGCFI